MYLTYHHTMAMIQNKRKASSYNMKTKSTDPEQESVQLISYRHTTGTTDKTHKTVETSVRGVLERNGKMVPIYKNIQKMKIAFFTRSTNSKTSHTGRKGSRGEHSGAPDPDDPDDSIYPVDNPMYCITDKGYNDSYLYAQVYKPKKKQRRSKCKSFQPRKNRGAEPISVYSPDEDNEAGMGVHWPAPPPPPEVDI